MLVVSRSRYDIGRCSRTVCTAHKCDELAPFHHSPRSSSDILLSAQSACFDRGCLWVGLTVRLTAGPSGHANSPHPSSREGHLSTARWSSIVLLSLLILIRSHAAAASRVQRNSVPSTHMRCMITASRRARATIAFFIPRRLAICIAQVCVPKTSSGDDFGFDRKNSLFLNQNSLFRRNYSLFCCVGNLAERH